MSEPATTVAHLHGDYQPGERARYLCGAMVSPLDHASAYSGLTHAKAERHPKSIERPPPCLECLSVAEARAGGDS